MKDLGLMGKTKMIKYFQLYICFLIYSFALVLSKLASQQTELGYIMLFLGLEFVALGLYAVIWQQILKRFPLVVAMANKGSTVIFSLLWAVVIFYESVTIPNIIGSLLIVFGISVVSWNE